MIDSCRDAQVPDLITSGRRSHRQRSVELWFIAQLNRFYVMAEHGCRTGWLKHLKNHPEAAVALVDYRAPVWAWILDKERDSWEWQIVAQLLREKYGWGDGLPLAFEPSAGLVELD